MEPETALQFLVQNLLQTTRNFESNDFEWLIPINQTAMHSKNANCNVENTNCNEAKPKRRVVLNGYLLNIIFLFPGSFLLFRSFKNTLYNDNDLAWIHIQDTLKQNMR